MRSTLRRRLVPGVVVVLVSLVAAGCGPAAPVGRFADQRFGVVHSAGITYGSAIDEFGSPESLLLDLYRPSGATGPAPAIIFVHGGGFNSGSRSAYAADAEAYARRGYVTATIDYRVVESSFVWFGDRSAAALQIVTDARHDAQAAVRWLRANAATYGIDAHRIAIVGYSAGAIIAVGVGQSAADPGDSGTPGESSAVCLAVSVSGTSVEDAYAVAAAPLLMFHGSVDPIVPTDLARRTAWMAAASGRLIGYHEFAGIWHLLPYERPAEISAIMVKELRDRLAEGQGC